MSGWLIAFFVFLPGQDGLLLLQFSQVTFQKLLLEIVSKKSYEKYAPPWFGKGPHHGSSRRKTKNKHFSQFLQQINTLCKLFSLHVKKYLSHYYFTIQSNAMYHGI